MPVVAVRGELVRNFLSSHQDPNSIRPLIRLVGKEMLMCVSESKSNLKRIVAERNLTVGCTSLEAFIDSLVLSRSDDPSAEDPLLKGAPNSSFIDLIQSENWANAVLHHDSPVKPNENRDVAFGRIFGHLFRAGLLELTIIDPFFFAKALKEEQVIGWLLKNFAQRGLRNLKILTKVDEEERFRSIPKQKRAESVCENIFNIAKASGFRGDIEIQTYETYLHDRYFAFKFSDGQFVFSLGNGVDMFKDVESSEFRQVPVIDSTNWSLLNSSKKINPSPYQLSEFSSRVGAEVKCIMLAPDSWIAQNNL